MSACIALQNEDVNDLIEYCDGLKSVKDAAERLIANVVEKVSQSPGSPLDRVERLIHVHDYYELSGALIKVAKEWED